MVNQAMALAGNNLQKMLKLNIAETCAETKVLGPGARFAIWIQGCPFKCRGCTAPDWIPFKTAKSIGVEELASDIIRQTGIAGITISGGEPMMQAANLTCLMELVKMRRPELNVIVFTGFQLEQLTWPGAINLLSHTDLLIDGQYIEQRNNGTGLRGSDNQKMHFLTDKLASYKDVLLTQQRDMEFHIMADGVLKAGIPSQNFNW